MCRTALISKVPSTRHAACIAPYSTVRRLTSGSFAMAGNMACNTPSSAAKARPAYHTGGVIRMEPKAIRTCMGDVMQHLSCQQQSCTFEGNQTSKGGLHGAHRHRGKCCHCTSYSKCPVHLTPRVIASSHTEDAGTGACGDCTSRSTRQLHCMQHATAALHAACDRCTSNSRCRHRSTWQLHYVQHATLAPHMAQAQVSKQSPPSLMLMHNANSTMLVTWPYSLAESPSSSATYSRTVA
eukprot:1147860-Pelagomonas_calceolata.AAC.1